MKRPRHKHKLTFEVYPGVVLLALLLSAAGMAGQMTIGDNLHATMNGSVGMGYSGGFGNIGRSSHGLGFGFDGILNGYYFNPRFINFDVRPYYNRDQSNSDFQTITRNSGIGGSVNFFGNSPYPGSVSIGRDYAVNSEFQFAGVPSVVADTVSQSFGVSWSLLLPHKPTLNFNFGVGNSDAAITGTNEDSTNSYRNLTLNSTYNWDGWNMFGNIGHYNASYHAPEILTGVAEDRTNSGTFYSFTVQHKIPLDGSFSFGWGHGDSSNNQGDHSSGTSYTVGVGISPWQKLGLSTSFSYGTNAAETLAYSVLGTSAAGTNLYNSNSKILISSNSASIFLGHGFALIGYFTWREEQFGPITYTDKQYGGTLSYRYSHRWLGTFYFSGGVVDTANVLGNAGTGLNATLGMDRRFLGWDVSADFNYLHSLQTLYTLINTSYLNYGGSVRKKLNPQTYLSLYTRETHSGLEYQSGNSNASISAGVSLSWKGYGMSGTYSSSTGTAVLNSTGTLVASPTAPLFTPDYFYFDGKAWGFAASKVFHRNLSVTGSYSNVRSSSLRSGIDNFNSGDRFGVTTAYHFRKLQFQGGFSRVNQSFRVVPAIPGQFPPQVVDSYFVSVSRWFNVF